MKNKKQNLYILKLSFISFINYSYIIVDEASGQAAIIDPAWELDKIINKIHETNVVISKVLLTHSHFDHTNLADRIAKKYNADIYMSKKEIEYYKFKCRKLNPICEGDIIQLGETSIKNIHTPGHTFGSTCYLVDGNLFTGDFIFIEGCGICTSNGASAREMYTSIQKIKSNISLETRIFPGHSYGKPPGYPLKYLFENNIYFQIDDVDKFIAFRQRKGQKGIFNFK